MSSLAVLAAAALTAVVSTPLAAALGVRARLVDRPDGSTLKIHRRPVALTGGYAVMLGVAVGVTIAGGHPRLGPCAAVALAFLVGARDDRRPVGVAPRLVAFVVAGVLLAADAGGGWPVSVLAVGLALAVPNAVNMIDGQDGLAAATAAVAAVALAAISSSPAANAVALSLAGALVGFVAWNRPPASVFLGNAGAYAIGMVLAASATRVAAVDGVPGVVAAGLALVVFAVEFASTVVRRLSGRRPLTGGDRDHTYDRIAARLDRPHALALCVALGAAGAVAAVALGGGA